MTSLTGPDLLASWLWCSIRDPGVPGSIPGRGTTGIFSLQVYFSSYYIWCLVPGWLPSEPKGDAMATESQKSLGIVENIWYKCFIVGWRSVVARQGEVQIINMYVNIEGA